MKMIVAVIKPSRLDAVLEAVTEAGASGLTVTEVRGYGRQRGKTEVYRGAEYEVKLLPKVKLEIAVPSDIADAVIEAVARTANTGKIGDGKVFVLDLEQAGSRLWPRFSGVLLMEAVKQTYALKARPQKVRVRQARPGLSPAPAMRQRDPAQP